MTNEPTQEQIKKLWIWCNPSIFRYIEPSEQSKERAKGTIFNAYPVTFPPITPDNLFKWAVPKLDYFSLVKPEHPFYKKHWLCEARTIRRVSMVENANPVLASFYAIMEVIDG